MDTLVGGLKAAGEPTRLRILAAVYQGELTVTDLCRVLGQSQPRVSRHLKLLCEAGLLVRHAEGSNAFFQALQALVPVADPVLVRDQQRIATIRAERADAANTYFETVAGDWDTLRGLHVADEEVESAMLRAISTRTTAKNAIDLLDIGTGTGRILELFSAHIHRGLGVDASREMLNVARSHLAEKRLKNCSVRLGNVYDLNLTNATFDVAVLHHVLHFLDDPRAAVEQAASALNEDGKLLIVDFATHTYDQLRVEFAHRRLGFSSAEIGQWCESAGLFDVEATSFSHSADNASKPLTVTLWVAERKTARKRQRGVSAKSPDKNSQIKKSQVDTLAASPNLEVAS
jgi:ubiquinone/menaquinone biosynthesis C-methylase UbiE